MVQLNSKKGFGVTYASGNYAEYEAMKTVTYKMGSDVFYIEWTDGEIMEKEVASYFSLQSLDNGSVIEF